MSSPPARTQNLLQEETPPVLSCAELRIGPRVDTATFTRYLEGRAIREAHMSKVTLSFEVEEDVVAALAEAAKANGEDVAQVLRDLAEDYVREQQEPEDEPDWLIAEIDEGLREADAASEDDWIPHEQAMAEGRAALEAHIAANAARKAGR
jgi:predicted transcriptional regulator